MAATLSISVQCNKLYLVKNSRVMPIMVSDQSDTTQDNIGSDSDDDFESGLILDDGLEFRLSKFRLLPYSFLRLILPSENQEGEWTSDVQRNHPLIGTHKS